MIDLSAYVRDVLRRDGDRVLYRGRHSARQDEPSILIVVPTAPETFEKLKHEFALAAELDSAFAVRPRALEDDDGLPILVLDDPGGEPLDRLLDGPMELGRFFPIAVGVAHALGELHARGLVHKDVKPANVLVDVATGDVRIMGFGVASRLPRERQAPAPPEIVAGTLAYMAPEQTGRMNRAVDSRSDLYALGVTLYEILTGTLPFTATEPIEWVHCHIARIPEPPAARVTTVPRALSAVVTKLLAKTPEDRYQTAAGVAYDLRRCRDAWERDARIDDFPLGERDTSDRLSIPERLYGRTREVDTLLGAFDRVARTGTPELVVVSGYSGIGKSSVVHELHAALVPRRGVFAAGKFDQYKRDIPYSTLTQAFQSLVRPLLAKPNAELSTWRERLTGALGSNARLITDLVPELTLLVGDPPPVPELPPQEAQRRFQLAFRRFLGVFARPEHPLALFLDDLQWLDAGTLDVLEDVLTAGDVRHVLLVGAYRDNEVGPAHPLTRKLDAIRRAGARVSEITLAPLGGDDVAELVADAFRCEPARAADLAGLIHEKTGGNPFFAIQFLSVLASEGLVAFDHAGARWSWDVGRIRSQGYTDNVVDLMLGKLARLSATAQAALRDLACLGNAADTATLALVRDRPADEVRAELQEAVQLELVAELGDKYRFAHDRIQEAAYSLLPEDRRPAAHLRIGRLLVARTPVARRDEAIFEIVNHLNRGAALMTARREREELAELNLIAGRRAKTSTAYASALQYLTAGAELLGDDPFERRHAVAFELDLHRAECELLTGAPDAAERRLIALATSAVDERAHADVVCLQVALHSTLGQLDRAVEVCLNYLRRVGIEWSPHPSAAEAEREYARIWSQLGARPIEAIVGLPRMEDPASRATLDVLSALGAPALLTDANLLALTACRAVNLSLERGNDEGSCPHYAAVGWIAGVRFRDYHAGFHISAAACEVMERLGLNRLAGRTYITFGHVACWTKPLREVLDIMRRGFELANETGDFTFAGYACRYITSIRLAAGDRLDDVEREAERGLAYARAVRFEFATGLIAPQLALVRTLRGATPQFGGLDDGFFTESMFEASAPGLAAVPVMEHNYLSRKLQARFLAGDVATAVDTAERARRLVAAHPSLSLFLCEQAELYFYGALAHAARCKPGATDSVHHDTIERDRAHLHEWATHCPATLAHRVALVDAEIARLDGRVVDAMSLYERAIASARSNGFVHDEAIANELAARFYQAGGFEKIARAYLRDARACYDRWGALGKVRQLDETDPGLADALRAPGATSTIAAPVEGFDIATVISVAHAIARQTALEPLIEAVMRTTLAQAGAERGVLLLADGGAPRAVAEAVIAGGDVAVQLRDETVGGTALPESIVQYVARTRESVIVDDVAAPHPFDMDAYVRTGRAGSICCVPLVNQGKLVAVLYLENGLAARVFTPARLAVLDVLASQAAISLENARLYRELDRRDTRIRRLVDANLIGVFIWRRDGWIAEANDTFLRMVGYDRDDLAAGRVRWTELTPAEWRTADERALAEHASTGMVQAYEKEYVRKDGSRVPILIGTAHLDEPEGDGVAFTVDLSCQKDAEAALQEARAALTHVARVTTVGEVTGSIAHELNQPLAAIGNNAEACLNLLDAARVDTDELRDALREIVSDAHRAAAIIDGIRQLARRSIPERQRLPLAPVVEEVVALAARESRDRAVEIRTEMPAGLPLVLGDRVQLQQVLLNLVVNAMDAMSDVDQAERRLVICACRDRHAGGPAVRISVVDRGVGLRNDHAERLFQPFHTTKRHGMGLGLAISRSIVESHGGRLWAEANPGPGATFSFLLPAAGESVAMADAQ